MRDQHKGSAHRAKATHRRGWRGLCVVSVLLLCAYSGYAEDDFSSVFEMSLEDLMNAQVISASKTLEDIRDVDSSIYVITEDDIRRSGYTHLLDVLNMVPGVWMQEMSHNLVSFGVRARIDEFPNTVRVVLDGVPIWSPVTGGPMFQYLNIPVEQIQRIEVIKGPGSTIYGANANTGVISIFTKQPEHVLGTYMRLSAGTQDYLSPFLRFGKRLSDTTFLSSFVSYTTTRGYDKTDAFDGDVLNVTAPDGSTVAVQNDFPSDDTDGQEAVNAGGVLQTDISDVIRSTTRFFVSYTESDVYTLGKIAGLTWIEKDSATDYYVSERLDFSISDTHSVFANAYFREQNVDYAAYGGWEPKTTIMELELQDNLTIGRHALSAGARYSFVAFDHENGGPNTDVTYFDTKAEEQLYGVFLQDTISFGEKVSLTMGVKAETWTLASNKAELSPNVRLAVKPDADLTYWCAVTRSVTTPGYFHRKMEHRVADVSGDGSAYVAIVPADTIDPISYLTYEAGLRSSRIPKAHVDISLFYSRAKDSISLDQDFISKDVVTSRVGDYSILPMYFTNTEKVRTYGGEALVRVTPAENVSAELSYSALFWDADAQSIPGQPGKVFTASGHAQPFTPEHIVRMRSYVDFPGMDLHFMLGVMYASESWRGTKFDYVAQRADDENGTYADDSDHLFKVDFNIEKRWGDNTSFNIWGQNILADDSVEFFSEFVASGYPHTIHPTFGCSLGYHF